MRDLFGFIDKKEARLQALENTYNLLKTNLENIVKKIDYDGFSIFMPDNNNLTLETRVKALEEFASQLFIILLRQEISIDIKRKGWFDFLWELNLFGNINQDFLQAEKTLEKISQIHTKIITEFTSSFNKAVRNKQIDEMVKFSELGAVIDSETLQIALSDLSPENMIDYNYEILEYILFKSNPEIFNAPLPDGSFLLERLYELKEFELISIALEFGSMIPEADKRYSKKPTLIHLAAADPKVSLENLELFTKHFTRNHHVNIIFQDLKEMSYTTILLSYLFDIGRTPLHSAIESYKDSVDADSVMQFNKIKYLFNFYCIRIDVPEGKNLLTPYQMLQDIHLMPRLEFSQGFNYKNTEHPLDKTANTAFLNLGSFYGNVAAPALSCTNIYMKGELEGSHFFDCYRGKFDSKLILHLTSLTTSILLQSVIDPVYTVLAFNIWGLYSGEHKMLDQLLTSTIAAVAYSYAPTKITNYYKEHPIIVGFAIPNLIPALEFGGTLLNKLFGVDSNLGNEEL